MTARTWLPTLLLLGGCAGSPDGPSNLGWRPESEARVVTQQRLQAECISPVQVYKVDGHLTSVSPQGFTLEAGRHELEAQGLVNTAGCPLITRRGDFILPPIEHDFRAGATYYLGVDHGARRFEDWRLRIWKIECAREVDCLADEPALTELAVQ